MICNLLVGVETLLFLALLQLAPMKHLTAANWIETSRCRAAVLLWVLTVVDAIVAPDVHASAKGYLYMLLVIAHSQALWAALIHYVRAVAQSYECILLFLVATVVTSALCNVLLAGKYQTGMDRVAHYDSLATACAMNCRLPL